MSTTTAADLISRADLLTRELRNNTDLVTLFEWESFDVTAFRLLHTLVGPGRADNDRDAALSHAAHVRVLQSYPAPLRPPISATAYSTREAAQLLGIGRFGVLDRIHRGVIPATTDGRSYGIAASDLDQRADLAPADPSDPRRLPRLSCTFGVLADLFAQERTRSDSILHEDDQVAALMTRVLTLTAVAARHTLGHSRVADADRPLVVAQFAERAVDALGTPNRLHGLDRITSCVPPRHPATLNERLEAALRTWAIGGRDELNRTVPSTDVLRNIANQGRHLYAVTDRLLQAPGQHLTNQHDDPARLSTALREASEALRLADHKWACVTTATPPSHEYVTAARDLFATLKDVGQLDLTSINPRHTEPAIDIHRALSDLKIASADLAELLHDAQHLPDVLIRSRQLFAPLRYLRPTLERLSARAIGYAEVTVKDQLDLASPPKRPPSLFRPPLKACGAFRRPTCCEGQHSSALLMRGRCALNFETPNGIEGSPASP